MRHSIRPFRLLILLALATTLPAAGCNDGVSPGTPDDEEIPDDVAGTFEVVTVADGLERPWGIAFLPDGDILVTERPGRLRVIRDGELDPEPVSGVPEVHAQGQGGLLDVELHPGFESNQLVYLSYSRSVGGGQTTTAVVRGQFDGAQLTQVEEVFEAQAAARPGRHYGSRINFDWDGYMYVTVGDRGQMNRAQDRSDHAGTTIRLHDDGRVPDDNPFVDDDDTLPEIFTYGNRNAQGNGHPPGDRPGMAERARSPGRRRAESHRGGAELRLARDHPRYRLRRERDHPGHRSARNGATGSALDTVHRRVRNGLLYW